MGDNHIVYLECVRPDIGKQGTNKWYWIERFDNQVRARWGAIGPRNHEGFPIKWGSKNDTTTTYGNSRQAEAALIKQMRKKMNPSGTVTNSATGMKVPKPPYKVIKDETGVFDLREIRGRLGILNHMSFDTA